MSSQKVGGGLLHGLAVETGPDVGDPQRVKGTQEWAVVNPILIPFSDGLPLSMKVARRLADAQDADIPWEERIQGRPQVGNRVLIREIKMSHLSQGVHSGVSPAGTLNRNRAAGQASKRLLQDLLNRPFSELDLPARKAVPDVLDFHPVAALAGSFLRIHFLRHVLALSRLDQCAAK